MATDTAEQIRKWIEKRRAWYYSDDYPNGANTSLLRARGALEEAVRQLIEATAHDEVPTTRELETILAMLIADGVRMSDGIPQTIEEVARAERNVMSIEQAVSEGFVHMEVDSGRCHLFLANEAGLQGETIVQMNAEECRTLAATLVDTARDLERAVPERSVASPTP